MFYLIDVATMADGFVAFRVVHHGAALFAVRQLIAANANNQVHIGEQVLGLQLWVEDEVNH